MGKDGELVINKRTIYELVKGKEIGSKGKKITSRDMFDTMCKKRNFSHRLGGDIVDMVFDLHNIVDDDRGNERARFIGFLNSQQDEIIISNASVPKRQRLDMSFEESADVDLDVSMTSQPDYEKRVADLEHQLRLKNETMELMAENHRAQVAQLQARIKELESRSVSELDDFFGHTPMYNQFKPPMRSFSIKCLSFGISSVQIRYMLKELADVLNRAEDGVPAARTLRDWRQLDMPKYNRELINEFVEKVDELSLLLDDTAMAGSEKVSAIGIAEVGNESNCIVMDLCYTSAKTGDELFSQIRDRILRQPLAEMIIRKTKNLMTDMGSQQVRANRLLLEFLNSHPAREGIDAEVFSMFCGMHTGRVVLNNVYNNFQ